DERASLTPALYSLLIPNPQSLIPIPTLQLPLHRIEHHPRQLLGDALADGAALDQQRAPDRLDGDIPPIARDALGAILEAGGLRRGRLGIPARRIGGDRRAVDQHPHRRDQILVDRALAVVEA